MTGQVVRSSGRQKVRPYGHRYVVAVTVGTDDAPRIVTHTIGELTVHQAMRIAARRHTDKGETVLGVTGARVTAKRKRGHKPTATLATPTDWDAVATGRHGLSYRPANR